MSKEKSLERIIYAINEAVKIGIKVNYHVIGDGPERVYLQNLAKSMQLDSLVKFYGEQENPYRYLRNADLLVISSKHEAAPMIIDEAIILSVPIFSTKTISAEEMIIKRESGWVCNNTDEEFIFSLLDIMKDRSIVYLRKEKMKKRNIFDFNKQAVNELKTILK